MAIGKPRGINQKRPVYVHVPKGIDAGLLASLGIDEKYRGRKAYVGSRKALRGEGGAQDLEREWHARFHGEPIESATSEMTCDQYADRWLAVKHGEGTRRPAPRTEDVNRTALKAFRQDFGDRPIAGGITREEALDWCKEHQQNAKAVSAMFNDAIDDGRATANPFANRRLPQSRGRKDIEPLREDEVGALAEIALATGVYGLVIAAWIMFIAWTGCRPGEAATREWSDIDFEAGRVRFSRIKGDKQTETVVLPPVAAQALLAMPGPRSGLLFRTAQGKRYDTKAYAYYWQPIRVAFRAKLAKDDPERLRELTRVKGALDVYALRHFCGSLMADRGLTEHDIAHQLGNSPDVCRTTYVHVHRERANDRVSMALSPNVVDLKTRRRGA